MAEGEPDTKQVIGSVSILLAISVALFVFLRKFGKPLLCFYTFEK